MPVGFKPYAETSVGDGMTCAVGTVADEDGLNQRPLVAMSQDGSRAILWVRELQGIEGMYQSRATHCEQGGDALYVLVQSDTDSSAALSQTVLSVTRLDLKGEVLGADPVEIPGTEGQAYSVYVDTAPGNFAWKDGRLEVKGEYWVKSSPDGRTPFVAEVAEGGGRG